MSDEIAPRPKAYRTVFILSVVLVALDVLPKAYAAYLRSDNIRWGSLEFILAMILDVCLVLFLFCLCRRHPAALTIGIIGMTASLTADLPSLASGVDMALTFTSWHEIDFLTALTMLFLWIGISLISIMADAYGLYLLVYSRELRAWLAVRNR